MWGQLGCDLLFISIDTGPKGAAGDGNNRFLDPGVAEVGTARLSHRTVEDVMRYLLNYINRNGSAYAEATRNCQ
jgi:hypothetical protein